MEASQSLRQAGTEITSTDHLYHSAHADRVLRLRRRLRRLFSFCSMLLFYSLTLCSWQPVLALNQLNSLPVAAVEQDRGQQVNNVHLVDHRWLRNGMLDPFDVQFSLLNSLSDGVAVSNLVLQADVLVALSALSQQGGDLDQRPAGSWRGRSISRVPRESNAEANVSRVRLPATREDGTTVGFVGRMNSKSGTRLAKRTCPKPQQDRSFRLIHSQSSTPTSDSSEIIRAPGPPVTDRWVCNPTMCRRHNQFR